jgi:hypothetical protein
MGLARRDQGARRRRCRCASAPAALGRWLLLILGQAPGAPPLDSRLGTQRAESIQQMCGIQTGPPAGEPVSC